jgi:hypothetical protein
VPARTGAEMPAELPHASFFQHVVVSPQSYLSYLFTLLAALILMFGGWTWWFEMKQHHFRHSSYAIVLALVLLGFLYVADALIFTDPIIADTFITTAV